MMDTFNNEAIVDGMSSDGHPKYGLKLGAPVIIINVFIFEGRKIDFNEAIPVTEFLKVSLISPSRDPITHLELSPRSRNSQIPHTDTGPTIGIFVQGAKSNISEVKPEPLDDCLLYTSPSPRDGLLSRMPSSA